MPHKHLHFLFMVYDLVVAYDKNSAKINLSLVLLFADVRRNKEVQILITVNDVCGLRVNGTYTCGEAPCVEHPSPLLNKRGRTDQQSVLLCVFIEYGR